MESKSYAKPMAMEDEMDCSLSSFQLQHERCRGSEQALFSPGKTDFRGFCG